MFFPPLIPPPPESILRYTYNTHGQDKDSGIKEKPDFTKWQIRNLKFENDMLRHQIDHLNNMIKWEQNNTKIVESMSIWQFIRFKLGF